MFAAAVSLGLLTGLLIGLSTSGVTASVVSAVLAMAAGVVALTGVKNPFLPKGESAAERSPGHNWAVAAFALTTVIALVLGLTLRTHNAFSPTPVELAVQWRSAGLSEEQARHLAVLQLTGASLKAGGGVEAGPGDTPMTAASVLFNITSPETCGRTDPARAPDAAEARNAWSLAPEPWPGLARALPEAPQATLRAVWSGLCEEQR